MKQATLTKATMVTVELPAGTQVFIARSDNYGTWFKTRAEVGGFVPNTLIAVAGRTIAETLAEDSGEEHGKELCDAKRSVCFCGKPHQIGQ